MSESSEDLDLPEGTLTVSLVLKGTDFLNGHFSYCQTVKSRAGGIRFPACNHVLTTCSTAEAMKPISLHSYYPAWP